MGRVGRSQQTRGVRLLEAVSSGSGARSVFPEAGNNLYNSVWLTVSRSPFGASTTLSAKCNTSMFRPVDPSVLNSEPSAVVGGEVVSARLSVRLRLIWLSESVFLIVRGLSVLGGRRQLGSFSAEPIFTLDLQELFQDKRVRCSGFYVYIYYSTGVCVFRPSFLLGTAPKDHHRLTVLRLCCISVRAAFRDEAQNFIIDHVLLFFAFSQMGKSIGYGMRDPQSVLDLIIIFHQPETPTCYPS